MFGLLKILKKSNNDVPEIKRSHGWTKVRNDFIRKNPECKACGSKKGLEVHHKKPRHTHPHLELKESNLITLCKHHHKYMGHLGYTKSWNPKVEKDAKRLRESMKKRPLKKVV